MNNLIILLQMAINQLSSHEEGMDEYSKSETQDLLRLIRLESVRVSNDNNLIGHNNYSRWG